MARYAPTIDFVGQLSQASATITANRERDEDEGEPNELPRSLWDRPGHRMRMGGQKRLPGDLRRPSPRPSAARIRKTPVPATGFYGCHTFNLAGGTESAAGFEEQREWARSYWSALSPYHTSVYVNFLMDEGQERIQQAYGPAKYQRLRALKQKYDPDNFFRLNQNIPPS